MGMAKLPEIVHQAKRIIRRRSRSTSAGADVPKGHLAIYVGEDDEEKKRFVVPISYLNQPLFQDLLRQAEEEFGIEHRMGALTIPFAEDEFIDVTSRLTRSCN